MRSNAQSASALNLTSQLWLAIPPEEGQGLDGSRLRGSFTRGSFIGSTGSFPNPQSAGAREWAVLLKFPSLDSVKRFWGSGAAGARFLGMEEVRGSIPLCSTHLRLGPPEVTVRAAGEAARLFFDLVMRLGRAVRASQDSETLAGGVGTLRPVPRL